MKILIIGSGSYVLNDPFGPGVVLRSLVQWARSKGETLTLHMTYHTPAGLPAKKAAVAEILAHMKAEGKVTVDFILSAKVPEFVGAVDACFIAVPDSEHAAYTQLCIDHDCPVWIVKPLTGSLPEARGLLKSASAKQTKVWVDYHKRFDTSNAYLKLKAESGDLGQMLVYSVDYHQPYTLPTEVFSWTGAVDVFTYIGCHYVDQVFYLFPNARPKRATATGVKGHVFAKTGQYDGVLATIIYDVGGRDLFVPMNIGWFNPKGSPTKSLQVLKIQFEQGLMDMDQTRRGVHIWHEGGVAEVNPYFFSETVDLGGDRQFTGYGYTSVQSFLDLVHSGANWPTGGTVPTIAEAVKTEEVLYGVQQALKTGRAFDFEALP